MRFTRFNPRPRPDKARLRRAGAWTSGFTLAEVLAALAFMAIVIPVTLEGLRIASLAGQVAQRKTVAARIAERVLNEWMLLSSSQKSTQRGVLQEGVHQYEWSLRSEPWNQDTMRLVTVEVLYPVQGENYQLQVSTLVDYSTL